MSQSRSFKLLLVLTVFIAANCRPISLTEKEINLISSALKETLTRHKISIGREISFTGTFDCIEQDCELSLDVQETTNGVLSGNDVLNGIGNGNGNDNGNNGNHNGNVIFQIFNAPVQDPLVTSTTTMITTIGVETTTTENFNSTSWWPTTQL